MNYPSARRRSFGSCFLAALTSVLMLATVAVAAGAGLLYRFPRLIPGDLRPQPMPTLQALAQIPTLAPSPVRLAAPPTAPPEAAATASPSFPPTQTPAPLPTETPTSAGPTLAPSSIPFAVSFGVQDGAPVALANFANTQGCNWMGVAGLALDLQGRHQEGLIVQLRGARRREQSLTGSAPAYGDSGYEFVLGTQPLATLGAYSLQLLDSTGQPLSDLVYINTYADCIRNLNLVIFVQNP